jgi:cytochrome c biogenesis protein CcmG/thiol:disulfide interchange protein DsbE
MGLRRRAIVLAAALSVVAVLAVLAVALARGRSTEDASATASGFEPRFEAPLFSGGTFALADHADGPAFVYFWASWCAPCVAEAPLIQRLYPEYQAKGYTFVGVNIWDAEPDARRFAESQGLTFPLVTDPGGKTYLSFGVQQLPTAFFLRRGLETDRRFIGALSEAQLREMLDHAGGG